MGVFHYRCGVTGLSLRGERAVMIWLWRSAADAWTPVSLPIRGTYDCYGSIDGITPDFNTQLLAEAFEAAVDSKQVKLSDDPLYGWKHPGDRKQPIEKVLHVIERATTCAPKGCVYGGRPLTHTLIAESVYDAVVTKLLEAQPEASENTGDLVEATFPSTLGRTLYREVAEAPAVVRTEARKQLHAFRLFRSWLEARAAWVPLGGGQSGQHGGYDFIRFHREAIDRFANEPWMLPVIDAVSSRAEELDPDREPGWVRHATESWFALVVGEERAACADVASLKQATQTLVGDTDGLLLFDVPVELLVVQRGEPKGRIDLKPKLRVKIGEQLFPMKTEAVKGLDIDLEAHVPTVYNWDELEEQLPPLEDPPARAGTERLYPVPPGQPPAWARPDEKWAELLSFGTVKPTRA